MVKVKICGITSKEDAFAAIAAGAWALGFVFYKKSPRYISPSRAQKIIKELPPFVTPVGLFVNHKEGALRDIVQFCGISTIQLHGEETPAFCSRMQRKLKVIKAFRVQNELNFRDLKSYRPDAYLFDSYHDKQYGGTGVTFNWGILNKDKKIAVPVILSGGLTPQNVREAVETVRPFAVDVSSGVEKSPGAKDFKLLKAFIEEASAHG